MQFNPCVLIFVVSLASIPVQANLKEKIKNAIIKGKNKFKKTKAEFNSPDEAKKALFKALWGLKVEYSEQEKGPVTINPDHVPEMVTFIVQKKPLNVCPEHMFNKYPLKIEESKKIYDMIAPLQFATLETMISDYSEYIYNSPHIELIGDNLFNYLIG